MFAKVTFGLLIFYFAGGQADLTKPCVPTEKTVGPCHECVCGIDGTYHCRRRTHCIEDRSEMNFILRYRKCEPLASYNEENIICTCNSEGFWRSNACYKNFQYIRPVNLPSRSLLRSQQSCIPNNLYLIDCNICTCGDDGKLDGCTTRKCKEDYKTSKCEYGDFLRTTDELCACSDNNCYIDRLCISIKKRRLQKINEKQLELLLKDKSNKRNTPYNSESCLPHESSKIDCNRCFCVDGVWACQDKNCSATVHKETVRSRKKEFLNLPEVFSESANCTPHTKYRYRCNTCICTEKEVLSCTNMICLDDILGRNQVANGTMNQLPEIQEGETCKEGKMYRKECNICRCTLQRTLKCTEKVCLQKPHVRVPGEKKLDLPDLPSGPCVEGKFYKKGCRKCYCQHDKKAVCAATPVGPKCKLEIKSYQEATPEDYGVKTQTLDLKTLPSLPNISTKCDPGLTYRVDCNVCICLSNKNLLCTAKLCLSIDDMNRLEARRRTGLPCNEHGDEKDPCMSCRCIDDKLSCQAAKNCDVPARRRLHGEVSPDRPRYPMTLDPMQDCVPQSVYKINCNRCYCQEDGALRCTSMTCLNYVQARTLQKLID